MRNILLISEDRVRTDSEISENIWGKSLLPAIKTAQNVYLQEFIGTCLLNKLQDLVQDGSITGETNVNYKKLLDDFIQPYMVERVVADLIPVVGSKIANLGVFKSTDEYASSVSADEVDRLMQRHIDLANTYAKRMQAYLKANRVEFPELDTCGCGYVKPCLDSSADNGLWLGGARGKIVR